MADNPSGEKPAVDIKGNVDPQFGQLMDKIPQVSQVLSNIQDLPVVLRQIQDIIHKQAEDNAKLNNDLEVAQEQLKAVQVERSDKQFTILDLKQQLAETNKALTHAKLYAEQLKESKAVLQQKSLDLEREQRGRIETVQEEQRAAILNLFGRVEHSEDRIEIVARDLRNVIGVVMHPDGPYGKQAQELAEREATEAAQAQAQNSTINGTNGDSITGNTTEGPQIELPMPAGPVEVEEPAAARSEATSNTDNNNNNSIPEAHVAKVPAKKRGRGPGKAKQAMMNDQSAEDPLNGGPVGPSDGENPPKKAKTTAAKQGASTGRRNTRAGK